MTDPDVVVVGGGAIGLSVALRLAEAGVRVAVLERGEPGLGCSYGNAGLIPPSYCEPLATPAALADGLRGLLDPLHPFRIRARADTRWLRWLLRFLAACRWEAARRSTEMLSRLCAQSLDLFSEWAARPDSFRLRRDGWLHVYATRRGLEAGLAQAERLRRAGVRPVSLPEAEARETEPDLVGQLHGAIYFPDDAHLDPFDLTRALAGWASAAGVRLERGTEVRKFRVAGGRVVSLATDRGEYSAGQYVVCAGAWSGELLRRVAGWIPIEPGRGHSLTLPGGRRMPRRPLMLAEAHLVITPMGDRLRMTSGLELIGFPPGQDREQLQLIRREAEQAIPSLSGSGAGEGWSGFRPMTPDGLPILGPVRRLANLHLATGHGTLGIALAPVTGKLVEELILNGRIEQGMERLLPARFGV